MYEQTRGSQLTFDRTCDTSEQNLGSAEVRSEACFKHQRWEMSSYEQVQSPIERCQIGLGPVFFWLLIIFSKMKVFCAKSSNCSKRALNCSLMRAGRLSLAAIHTFAIERKFSKAFYEG